MPIYEYFCEACRDSFEIKVSLSEKEKALKVSCPKCGSNKTVQILGNFSTFTKEGSSGCCGPDAPTGCCG